MITVILLAICNCPNIELAFSSGKRICLDVYSTVCWTFIHKEHSLTASTYRNIWFVTLEFRPGKKLSGCCYYIVNIFGILHEPTLDHTCEFYSFYCGEWNICTITVSCIKIVRIEQYVSLWQWIYTDYVFCTHVCLCYICPIGPIKLHWGDWVLNSGGVIQHCTEFGDRRG